MVQLGVVDSLGNWEYTCVIPLNLLSGLFLWLLPVVFFVTIGGVQLWFFHVKSLVSLCLDCLIGIVIFSLKLIHNHKSTSRGFLVFFKYINSIPSRMCSTHCRSTMGFLTFLKCSQITIHITNIEAQLSNISLII